MSGFRIVREETHKFKKNSLFVLMFNDGTFSGIDVADDKEGFGRMTFEDKSKAKFVFDLLNKRLSKIRDFQSAVVFVQNIIDCDLNALRILFLYSQDEILKETEVDFICFFLGLETEYIYTDGEMTMVKVNLKGDDRTLGEFVSENGTEFSFFKYMY